MKLLIQSIVCWAMSGCAFYTAFLLHSLSPDPRESAVLVVIAAGWLLAPIPLLADQLRGRD